MWADTDIQNLLSGNIRLCMGNIMTQVIAFAVLSALRRRRRSLLPMILFTCAKSTLMMTLISLRIYYGDTEELLLLSAAAGVAGTLFAVRIGMWTYEGDFITILFSMAGTEVVSESILQASVLLTNLLEGRPEPTAIRAAFQWADIQILLWEALLFAGVRVLLFPVLQKFRSVKLSFPKLESIIKAVLIFFIITGQLQGLTDFGQGALFFISKYIITLATLAASVAVIYLIVRKYQRDVRQQREFLLLQKERIEKYYLGMQGQIREMERNQQNMSRRMEEIIGWRKEQAALYLKELRDEYAGLRGGIYCNDRMTDAVLCCQKEAAESMGISVEYAMNCYARERISEEDISRLLFYLLDFGIRESRKNPATAAGRISLHAGAVKNQLVFDFFTTCTGDTKTLKTAIRDFLEKWSGTITELREKQGTRIVIALQRDRGEEDCT